MNCAYQYSHPAHPQNVMTMPPTAVQQPQHSTDTEYLEFKVHGLTTVIRELIEAIEESTNDSWCVPSSDQLMLDRIPHRRLPSATTSWAVRGRNTLPLIVHLPVAKEANAGRHAPRLPGFSLTRCQFISANSIRAIANRISRNRISRSTGRIRGKGDSVKHGEVGEQLDTDSETDTCVLELRGRPSCHVINHESKALALTSSNDVHGQ
ncbi:hypothetical protein K0M31_009767 [Melipona bicolor]|uniref:Uncharacterized protein n=1 Tax=Melipona bicolor TaxID=60889 RepID=A0AA40FN57_9HYME|nr:hypothetical protein K0M31_009767 [Melipona bicolor]